MAKAAATTTSVFGELESIRGIAALLVVLYHVPAWNAAFARATLVRNGYLMVELFFVLSGFVIFRSYANRMTSLQDVVRFQFLRFGRLYPVHLLFLVAFLLLLNGSRLLVELAGRQPEGAGFQNSVGVVIQQLTLTQAIGPWGHALSLNTPAWSISVEFYTYLVFALVALLTPVVRNVVFVSLFVMALLAQFNGWLPGFSYVTECFAGFFLGCLTACCAARWKPDIGPMVAWASLLALMAFLLWREPRPGEFEWPIYFLTAIVILAMTGPTDNSLRAALRVGWMRYLGELSYSVYMSHALLIALFEKVLRVMFGVNALTGTPLTGIQQGVVVGLLLGLIVAVSALVYEKIEKPCRSAARAFAAPGERLRLPGFAA